MTNFRGTRVHHVGLSVSDLDAALAYWFAFLGVLPLWRRRISRPYLADIVGYPGVEIEIAVLDLGDGALIELLDYSVSDKVQQAPLPADPGGGHVCLEVLSIDDVWASALAAGAESISAGPVDIDFGVNAGARGAYLRIHDQIILELFEPAST